MVKPIFRADELNNIKKRISVISVSLFFFKIFERGPDLLFKIEKIQQKKKERFFNGNVAAP